MVMARMGVRAGVNARVGDIRGRNAGHDDGDEDAYTPH